MTSELKIDGQHILLLDDDEWDVALRDGFWGDLPVCHPLTKPVIEAMSRFTRAHSEAFRLVISKNSVHAKTWMVMNLFAVKDGWQRVQIERVQCGTCGTEQWIANPTDAELYLGVKEWAELMKRATASGSLHCVQCNQRLPRFAIWAEAVSDE